MGLGEVGREWGVGELEDEGGKWLSIEGGGLESRGTVIELVWFGRSYGDGLVIVSLVRRTPRDLVWIGSDEMYNSRVAVTVLHGFLFSRKLLAY